MEEKMLRRWNDAPEIRKIDEESRTVEFVASDNSVDSYGTVIPVDKWDLTRFASNGIIGYMHDVYGDSWTKSADPDDVIGKGEAFIEDDKLIVRITFEPADLNEKADKIFRKLQFGSLHAVSVGFRATKKGHMGDEERGEERTGAPGGLRREHPVQRQRPQALHRGGEGRMADRRDQETRGGGQDPRTGN